MGFADHKLTMSQGIITALGEPVRISVGNAAVTVQAHFVDEVSARRQADGEKPAPYMDVMVADVQALNTDSGAHVLRGEARYQIVSRDTPRHGRVKIYLRRIS